MGGVAELHGKAYVLEMKHRTYDWYLKLLPGLGRAFPAPRTWWSFCVGTGSPAPWHQVPTGSKSRRT